MAKRSAAMPEQNMQAPPFRGLWHVTPNRTVLLLCCLFGLSTAVADPEPDMDASGCVDLYDIALFQNQFGTIDIPGIAPCDFYVDGYCDILDYEVLASVLRGPICDCTADADCNDSYPCTIDDCYSGVCQHRVTCPNQDDADPDCIHEYCTVAGCVAADEPDSSPCDDEVACTVLDFCLSGQCTSAFFHDSPCGGSAADDADAGCSRGHCTPNGCVDDGSEPNGSPCVDGVSCTTDDFCRSGLCRTGTPNDSLCPGSDDDSDPDCADVFCSTGVIEGCVATEFGEPDGSPCVDGVSCTTDDFCRSGLCRSDTLNDSLCPNHDDGDDDCVLGYCTPTGCALAWEPDGSICDDGVSCTAFDYCNAGRCLPGISICGNDNDADADCLRANCDPFDGCFLAIEPDGSPCEDGIACTGSDYCISAQCYGGIYYDFLCPNQDYCDDDCIQYYCAPGQGCVPGAEFESAPCWDFFCAIHNAYSACNAGGFCECRAQPPPNFGCP